MVERVIDAHAKVTVRGEGVVVLDDHMLRERIEHYC